MKITEIVSYSLLTATGLQSVVFLTITITWRRERSENNEHKTSELCTDCKDLLPHYDYNGIASKVEKLRKSQDSRCCGGTGEIIRLAAQKETTDMFFNRIRYMVTEAVYQMCDSYVEQTPYVRAVEITRYIAVGAVYQLLWNKNGRTVTQPSIHHITHLQDEGEIFIRRAGLYKVTSQLVIDTNGTLSDRIFSHFIYVLSHKYGTRRILGERKSSLLDRQNTISILSAVFNLDLHDRLSVAITNPVHIDTRNNDNVFSVHFVDSK